MAITKDQFREWAADKGWEADQHGHLQKAVPLEVNGEIRRYRYKLTKIAVRYELRVGDRWVRIKSGYFGKMAIVDNKLEGMKR